MSKDIIVITPNGRRHKVHCNPDTSILQVLEDTCKKHGYQPNEYDLKHHNHILDLTTSIRFSNLPNKACLEMVEVQKRREESNVTIGLSLEDGDRRTGDFPSSTSLYDIAVSLAPGELEHLNNPTIIYMRQEIIGVAAMKEKSLRQLGLISGRAVLRLLNKSEGQTQANVSAIYRAKVQPDKMKQIVDNNTNHVKTRMDEDPSNDKPSTSLLTNNEQTHFKPLNPLDIILKEKAAFKSESNENTKNSKVTEQETDDTLKSETNSMDVEHHPCPTVSTTSVMKVNLERRLNIEEEVTFLGAQKAIVFRQPEGDSREELEDLPDDFYDLTVEEVRRLYHDLQQQRLQLENTPLITSSQKQEIQSQNSSKKLNMYKNVVVRVQFPDQIILQGIFVPTNTIQDVITFIKQHLRTPDKPFHIFTTPLKESMDPDMTLLDAKLVPCVHMHFKWLEDDTSEPCLKDDIYSKQTPNDVASILASKYRAPSRQKHDDKPSTSHNGGASSKTSKLPKWFKK